MTQHYSLVLRRLWQAPVIFLLLAMLAFPALSWGQTFTETFGTAGPKSVVDADAEGDFDNSDIPFFYGDNTSLVTPGTGSIPASPGGGSFIYFGDANGAPIAANAEEDDRTFSISQINTENITDPVLTFRLFIPNRSFYKAGDLVVDYTLDGDSYIPIRSIPATTTNGWRTITISNPFGSVTSEAASLRFRRLQKATGRLAIDDVVLSGTTPPNFAINPTLRAFPNTGVTGTSTAQTFSVDGSGLTSNINAVAPTGFLIRQQGIGAYGTTVDLVPTDGSVNAVVEVVFSPQTAGPFDEQITLNTTGVNQQTVRVTGTAVLPNIAVSPTSLTLPATAVGGTSAPRSISVTGSNLSGNINVVAPAGFLVRRQNVGTYGATLALTPTSGNISTVVEVVFNPQAAGLTNGQITFDSDNASRRTVAVNGTAVSPTIILTPTSLAFGNVEVNTQSGVQSIGVEGSNLSANISVQVPSGYEFRKAGDATFLASGATLTLAQTNGIVNTSVEVRFAATTTGAFNGNATFISTGATTQFAAFTGTSVNPAPVVTVSTTNPATPNSNTISFANTQVGRTSAPISFFVSGQNLDNNTVVVSSPSNEFLIRLANTAGGFSSQVILTGSGGTLAVRELEVQFSPAAAGTRSAIIAASSGTTVNEILQVTGNALPAPTTPEIFITPDPATLDFGSVAANGSAEIRTFKVGGTLLGGNSLILTPASSFSNNENIEIREANVGDFQTGPLVFPAIKGSVTERTIQVRLTGPLTLGQYQGIITASSPNSGAPQKEVNVIANSTGNSATVSVNNTLQLFSTVPTVASAIQSFQVNGSGLVRDITVRAPAFFQVSLSSDPAAFDALGGTTGNTITVARNNVAGDGLTNPVTVYVRYLPASANPQPDLASINVTSEPAIGAAVQVEGFSAPSIEVLTTIPEIRNVENGKVSAPLAVTIRAMRVRQAITIAELLTDPSQFNNPLQDQFEISLDSNTGFGSTVTFAPNQSTYSVDQVIYVRYKPTHLGNASSKLLFRSQDFENKGFQDFASNTGSIRGNALDNQPTAQTTISVVRNGSTATVNFTPAQGGTANGAGEGRLIIASLNNGLDGNSQPQDGQTYLSQDGTIGQGRSLASGYFSVYTGTANQATVKGLDPTKAYYFYVFDYNYVTTNTNGDRLSVPNSENYLTPTPATQLVPVAAVTPGEPEVPLPIELVSFTAKLQNNVVNLNWVTASEKDNKGFEVQRSQDAKEFSTILFKKGHGTTNSKTTYTAVDREPLLSISYYRLKQVDNDGKTSFSPVVAITNHAVAEIAMYPNPVQNILNIRLPQSAKAAAQVTITDLTGRVLRTEQLAANGELNMSGLSTGTYLVTVNDGTQKVTRRIVKN